MLKLSICVCLILFLIILMGYNAVDIFNLQTDISTLKCLHDKLISLNHEICACLVRVEYFLEHYTDYTNQDDLPL